MTEEVRVAVADWAVAGGDGVLFTVRLGLCVAIPLYDPAARIGGRAHVLLPSESLSRDRRSGAMFPARAVPLRLREIEAVGASRSRIGTEVVGGAPMFVPLLANAGLPIGERNVLASRAALNAAGLPILAQAVGGEYGCSVFLRLTDGRLFVRSLIVGDPVL